MSVRRHPGGAAAEPARPAGLRIAVVTETYPPEINGVAGTVARLVEGFLGEGHRVELIRPLQPGVDTGVGSRGSARRAPSSPGRDTSGAIPDLSERLTRGMSIPGYAGLRMGLPAPRMLRRAWRSRRPDLVHIATEGPLGWSALRVARGLGIPVVSEFRTNFHAYSGHYGVGLLRPWVLDYLRWFHNRCALTMVPTRRLAGELEASGFERLQVVGRGVDAHRFNPRHRSVALRASWGAGPDELVAISVGRLAPEKNLELLVQTDRLMRSTRPGMRLVVVGDGPARSWLEGRIPGAIFVGRRMGDDLATHYASADLLLFPSLTETFGNVTLEAMASGLPVIAFDYGAAGSHVTHGVHGWLAPFGEAEVFAGLGLLAAGDPDSVRRFGAVARRQAESMSWQHIVRQVLEIHREAIGPTGCIPSAGTTRWDRS